MADAVDDTQGTGTHRAGALTDDTPPHRYGARLADEIERRWQDRWDVEQTFYAPNPSGPLAEPNHELASRPSLYVLDMFPYPSGVGLHVGHPLGYIATDIYSRFRRMQGDNVLHAMGYDAFGLPAEQYAIQTGQHPRVTTEANITSMRAQLRRLGLGHDPRRGVATTDPAFYRWTQWIFLQIFESWYDADAQRARPIVELEAELDAGTREPAEGTNPSGRPWSELSASEQGAVIDAHRLAYRAEIPVNWCPALGTVLANEEVTADGRSERGNHPVFLRPLQQWMMRITAYADRLVDDLDLLDWPEPITLMQRNWIGRSEGADVDFAAASAHGPVTIRVFTTRPDTLFGATYMVLAPEHPLVDDVVADAWPSGTSAAARGDGLPGAPAGGYATPREAVAAYRVFAGSKTTEERQAEGRAKTGVSTGASAVNPVDGNEIPVFVADYVLMGYGTGAIMAVPAHDQRDFEFARVFDLPMKAVVQPGEAWVAEFGLDPADWPHAPTDGVAMQSANAEVSLDGLGVDDAKHTIVAWLESKGLGQGRVTTRLRDWLFSRQRYWGEPFPIVYEIDPTTGRVGDRPIAMPDALLPVDLPELDDFAPRVFDDAHAEPELPLSRRPEWVEVDLDLGDGRGVRRFRRELNTMPNWAGSCWYYLRYTDPTNAAALVDPEIERYWMSGTTPDGRPKAGGVDLYVGGAEHAVLHLLYARFWHKVLFDLGHVSTPEPFQRLFNQGYIQAHAYRDDRGVYVDAEDVVERDGGWFHDGKPVTREYGKMGKSLKNAVAPDDICRDYGADTLRLYEMYMGRLAQSKPWNTRDIVGVHKFLRRLWAVVVDERTGEVRVTDDPPDAATRKLLHRTIDVVGRDMADLAFNTAIARLIELVNHLTPLVAERGAVAREVAESMTLMLAPLAPHVAEELWSRLGHPDSLAHAAFPTPEAALLVDDEVEIPVTVNKKPRGTVRVPADADAATLEAIALADPRIAALLDGREVRKVIAVPGRIVNIVVG
jgi:leucyl-tRNA synthetase